MEESRTSQFSLCGNFFAHANRNGVLKIWETHSGKLHQDYTPSSHLASLGSCLQWAPFKMRQGSGGGGTKKKKKQRLDPAAAAESAAIETLNLLAWGTEPGDILLYSFAKGELHNRLVGGHANSRVNDLCWSADGTRLFSCAEDRLLAEWDVVEGKLMDSWKFKIQTPMSVLPDLKDTHGQSDWIFELPIEFGGNLDSEAQKAAKDNLMVFDIKT